MPRILLTGLARCESLIANATPGGVINMHMAVVNPTAESLSGLEIAFPSILPAACVVTTEDRSWSAVKSLYR